MNSAKGKAIPRLRMKYNVEGFFKGDSFSFVVKQRSGFEWMYSQEVETFKQTETLARDI